MISGCKRQSSTKKVYDFFNTKRTRTTGTFKTEKSYLKDKPEMKTLFLPEN